MNYLHAALWGFAATVVLVVTLSASTGLGLTRIDLPLLLGTMFTPDRDKAKWIGALLNFVNGWIFAMIYIELLREMHLVHWWAGALVGLIHALFVLLALLPLLPSFHPRMANEVRGPDPTKQLEPPGFFALHYGRGTPIATIVAHVLYGGILGMFYK